MIATQRTLASLLSRRSLPGLGAVLGLGLFGLVAPVGVAHAQDFDDDDEIVFEDEAPPESPDRGEVDPSGEGESTEMPDLIDDEDEGDLEFEDEVPEEGDPATEAPADDPFLEDEVVRQKEGEDTGELYREQLREMKGLEPDEEVMAWEAYLTKYPASVFRERIDERIDELMKLQHSARIVEEDERVDAKDQEIILAQAIGFSNVNPRSRVTAALDFGIPSYVGGQVDFEYAFLRTVSAHAGISRQFSGWGLDVGGRWAFVKSTRAQLVTTLSVDARIAMPGQISGVHARFRPTLGLGKALGPVQLLAQVGTDIETRPQAAVALFGGLNVTYRAADAVAVFVETNAYARQLGRSAFVGDGSGAFVFNQLGFGLKFFPPVGKRGDDPLELTAGANMPYYRNYLGYYEGSVSAQGVYYLD